MFWCCSLRFTVLLMFCFTCFHAKHYETIKATNTFIYSLSLLPRFRQNRRQKVFKGGFAFLRGTLHFCEVA